MTHDSAVEQIAPGLTREWRHGRRMVIYTLTNPSRQAIDAYIDSNIELVKSWPRDQIMYNVQDISHKNMVLTEHFRARLTEVADVVRGHGVRTKAAIILPDTLMFRVFSMFGRFFVNRSRQHIIQRYFVDRKAGIEWVEAQMETDSEPANSH
jgi:hypothetical protein